MYTIGSVTNIRFIVPLVSFRVYTIKVSIREAYVTAGNLAVPIEFEPNIPDQGSRTHWSCSSLPQAQGFQIEFLRQTLQFLPFVLL